MIFKRWPLFILSLLIFNACITENEDDADLRACIDQGLVNKDAVCTEQYEPVCGCDLETYSNACRAEAAGLTYFSEGECVNTKLEVLWKQWVEKNINHYSFVMSYGCGECMISGTYIIEVKNKEVLSIKNKFDTESEINVLGSFPQTIDALFKKVKQAYLNDADELKITYDEVHGFPSQISIDYDENTIDDELSFSLTDFIILD